MDTGTGGDGEKITGINSSGSETALLTINSEKKQQFQSLDTKNNIFAVIREIIILAPQRMSFSRYYLLKDIFYNCNVIC